MDYNMLMNLKKSMDWQMSTLLCKKWPYFTFQSPLAGFDTIYGLAVGAIGKPVVNF
jgi:hypothetical protein